MTLAAPRSRQGKAFLVVAILVAVAASLGALFWVQSARADLPTTTITLIQAPGTPGPVAAGTTVTYTMTTTTTGPNSSGAVVMTITVDTTHLQNEAVTCPAANSGGAGITWTSAYDNTTGIATCTSSAILTAALTNAPMTVAGEVIGNVAAPSAAGAHDGAGPTVAATANGTVGPLGSTAGATVAPSTNFPGQPHTFVFNLAQGWTCNSDLTNDEDVECTAADVSLTTNDAACTVSAPTVAEVNPGGAPVGPSTVSVTVTPGNANEGTCTVALAILFVGVEDDSSDDCCASSVSGVKAFSAAIFGGELRHLDIPDAATEDVAGNQDPFCDSLPAPVSVQGPVPAVCGIIGGQDDVDDAIGSFHAACIVWSDLTYSLNGSDITWTITPVGGGPVAASVQGFGGPGDIPCVMWGAGTTGTQQITATYAPGAPSPSINYYYNEYCVSGGICTALDNSDGDPLDPPAPNPLPLIKEWNTIDSTKIVGVSGDVGTILANNTADLTDWSSRDCVDSTGFCGRANLDGTTKDIGGVLFPFSSGGCPDFTGGCISAGGASFIDYTMGSHNDAGGAYDGPVDGALQTYTVSGDCGSVRLEDPTTGVAHLLSPDDNLLDGNSATVLSSDKGVGFQVVPNNNGGTSTTPSNADCSAESCVTVTIDTQEDNLFHSPPLFEANTETITVCFHVGPPTNKQPLLAWAGQRVVLEHDWSFFDENGERSSCPFEPSVQGNGEPFYVRYLKEFGNGGFVSDFGDGAATGPDFMVVRVFPRGDSNANPNEDCISRVLYESQDQGEQDVVAHVVECETFIGGDSASVQGGGAGIDPDTCSVVSEQVAFLVYYMKFEDIKLVLLPDQTGHGLSSQESTAVGAPAGESSTSANVSENVLARATVRGWVLTDNCPARDSAVGSNGEFIPANRCIFPDDWRFKAGGDAALEARPNYDIYGGFTGDCSNVAGPFSQLDAPGCGGSMAPHAPFDNGFRETNFPDGVIDANDAPMPSALIRFLLSGSGFLLGTTKSNPTDQFNVTHIPAEPWISPINADLSGYQWNSWGNGPKSGVYHYWTDLADHGPEVLSCSGPSEDVFVGDTCPNEAPAGTAEETGGYQLTRVYSDEHGVAMTWVNGDANLGFDDCADNVGDAGHNVVLLNGFFCQSGDVVGHSTLNALADYPDKRKHFAILSDDVTITWTWGGIKEISVVDDPADSTGQFHYVVFHVTDRDGFCDSETSLHPVLGEEVQFHIDSDSGVIVPDVNGNEAEGPPASVSADNKEATTTTFDTSVNQSVENGGITVEPVVTEGECQAWIHISESLLNTINVIVTAFDPEGTVTFDTIINPTPTPSPVPTATPVVPTPTPFTLHLKWGDSDCDGNVAPRDAQAVLKHFLDQTELSQSQPCPAMGERVMVASVEHKWGDWDCNGAVAPRDDQADLKHFLSQAELSQTAPCSTMGSNVDVIPLVP